MPSPFPGMNPYLEQSTVWHDFHETLLPTIREAITAQVRPRYVVKVDEHIYIHELPEQEERRLVGRDDLTVAHAPVPAFEYSAGGTATIEAPVRVRLPEIDIERQSFLEIRDRDSGLVVTVIELLSPANKQAGPDREQYLRKRAQLLKSEVHLIEIDLLRGGPRLPLQQLPTCSYYVLLSRAEERPNAGLWPIQLSDSIPTIPIPLSAGQSDATLNIQAALHRVYDAAGYDDYIYRNEPQPPLTPEQNEWAKSFVPSRK